MSVSTVRAVLALMVVGVFMAITAFMAVYPLISEAKVGLGDYSDFFAKTASVYTGIIGVIIGYYFGRAQDRSGAPSEQRDQPGEPQNPSSPEERGV